MAGKNQMKVYRYMSFRRFAELLFTQELALVNPAKWPDQYETYAIRELLDGKNQEKYRLLFDDHGIPFERFFNVFRDVVKDILDESYCLCFSRSKDAEVMWNAYGYQNNAVMIRTSVDKLQALSPEYLSVFRVRYDLKNTQVDSLLEICEFDDDGGVIFHDCDELLRHKRKCFQYENEMRLVGASFYDVPHRLGQGIVYLPIGDISDFVERVMAHPLADDGYVNLIKKMCSHFGIQFWGRSKIYEFKRN